MLKQGADNQVSTNLTTESVSALIDGEMNRTDAEAVITALCADHTLQRTWHEMHRAGDALRSNEVAACDAHGFCARVRAAIFTEPTILAPRATQNSSGLRRYWVPGLAVAASVAAIGFIAVPLLRAPETASMARNATPAPVEVQPVEIAAQKSLPTIANARGLNASFNPYLAAHRELIGNSVVPRAAVYLRSAEDR